MSNIIKLKRGALDDARNLQLTEGETVLCNDKLDFRICNEDGGDNYSPLRERTIAEAISFWHSDINSDDVQVFNNKKELLENESLINCISYVRSEEKAYFLIKQPYDIESNWKEFNAKNYLGIETRNIESSDVGWIKVMYLPYGVGEATLSINDIAYSGNFSIKFKISIFNQYPKIILLNSSFDGEPFINYIRVSYSPDMSLGVIVEINTIEILGTVRVKLERLNPNSNWLIGNFDKNYSPLQYKTTVKIDDNVNMGSSVEMMEMGHRLSDIYLRRDDAMIFDGTDQTNTNILKSLNLSGLQVINGDLFFNGERLNTG